MAKFLKQGEAVVKKMWVLQIKEHIWRGEDGEPVTSSKGRWTVIFKNRWKFVVMMYYQRRNTPINQWAGVEYRILKIEPLKIGIKKEPSRK